MRIFSLIMFVLFLTSCNKPDSNPELKDPIYSDLKSSFVAKNQQAEAEKKKLLGFEQELRDVVPQSGQIKYAQKRVFETQARVRKLLQEAQYLELKIQARKTEVKKSYQAAFSKGEDWPNPNEWAAYETAKKLREASLDWDSRRRIKEFSSGAPTKPVSGGH